MASRNEELFERACKVIPGGVNSPVRAFGSVGGTPYFVTRGEGSKVWDADGREYIDYVQSYGASILGHAHPKIVAALAEAAPMGTTYGAPTEREVLLAEEIVDRVEGVEMVRLVNSGTEAAMTAIRLARGVTGRTKVIKFAGNYHGHTDALLAAGGSGVANQGLSGSVGVPESAVAATVVAPYNVIPEIDSDTAVVAVEPVAANMGLVAPEPGFLEGLREACDKAGALLLFDEVITGFRLARGGAQERFGVRPDVWCFGKVIGGGLPVGAFAATAEVMSNLAPVGPVYQAGTLSGNPLATAAGLAVLAELDAGAYDELEAKATKLQGMLTDAITSAGVAATIPRQGPLLGIFFTDEAVRNYDDANAAAENGKYAPFFHGLLERGIALAPGAYEIMFPSLAHTDADFERTAEAAAESAAALL